MKDKMLDIVYLIKDKLEELWWFIQDNIKMTLGIIGVFGFLGLVFLMLNVDNKNNMTESEKIGENTPEQLAYIKGNSEELKEVFSELQTFDTSIDDNPVLEIALYLKQPFMSADDVSMYLEKYVYLLKLKYNDPDKDVKIRAIKIEIYDRKLVFDNDLQSNGTYTYMLSSEYVDEVDENDYDKQNVGMSDLAWEQTILNKKEPNYEQYTSNLDFKELKMDSSITPLTDEEFAWFLKFEQYIALGGGVDGGAEAYLQWDLGANIDKGGFISIISSFNNFIQRLEGLDSRYTFYSEDVDNLRRILVIKNPQFLLYAEHEELIEEPFAARARLIEINPDLYTPVVESWIETQSENYSEEDDPASLDNPDNKTNTQLIESEGIENQDDELLDQSTDAEKSEDSTDKKEDIVEDTDEVEPINETD